MTSLVVGLHEDTNACAAVVQTDGSVLGAVAEGRLTRQKYQAGFPARSLSYFVEQGWSHSDPHAAIVAANPLHPLPRVLGGRMPSGERDFLAPLQTAHLAWHEMLFRSAALRVTTRAVSRRALKGALGRAATLVGHHASHAASAYFCGPWAEATVVTCDNMGDGECARAFHGRHGRLEPLWVASAWNSPGQFYGEVASLLGIDPMTAGKVTGLAARGRPDDASRLLRTRLRPRADGRGFEGPPLSERHARARVWQQARLMDPADVAAGAQQVLEEAVLPFVRAAIEHTGCPNVVLAGGVFANVSLNRAVLDLKEVENLSVHPAMSDQGIALGAALLHVARTRGLQPRPLRHVFLGPSFGADACAAAVETLGPGFSVERPSELFTDVADLLADGAVVARYDGALEYGPRALGNRSILARTDDPAINEWLNARLDRSEYMPFAPVTLASEAPRLFEGLRQAQWCARFMTVALRVTKEVGPEHAAVVHVDGTARPQILRDEDNPGLHAILSAFYRRTGVPSLVNTSFNRHGEPIVCTPAEAIDTFLGAGLDALALGPFLVRRLTPVPRG